MVVTPNGDSIKFYYNAANDLQKKFSPSDTVDYAYDSLYNLSGISDADSSLSFVYDAIGRLIQAKTNPGFLQPQTAISYTYDRNNNLLSMLDPQGIVTRYLYDSLNRLTNIKDQQDQVIAHFAYDELSRRISQALPNGITTSFSRDLKGQLLSLTHNPLSLSYAYTYDKVGNQKTKTDTEGLHSYSYDNIYRLLSASHPNPPQEQYSYDAVGNRNPSSFTYDTANRLLENSSYTYDYDNNGNLIKKTSKQDATITTYTYDAEDRLIGVTIPTTQAIYSYDPLGRRIGKNVNGTITRYLYDGEDILLEYDGTNTLQSRYTHGPGIDEPLVMERGGQSYYYHADALGSIITITDSAGNVVQSYTYESFGKVSQTGSLTQPYTYTGRELDPETGLYYYRSRYYDPDTGRFLQEDPLWDTNLYAYVGNNPLNWIDPWGWCGKKPWWEKFEEGYFYGTGFGQEAAEWYAQQQLETGNPLWAIPGSIASLWTPERYQATGWTLITAYSFNQTFVRGAPKWAHYEHARGPHKYPHIQLGEKRIEVPKLIIDIAKKKVINFIKEYIF